MDKSFRHFKYNELQHTAEIQVRRRNSEIEGSLLGKEKRAADKIETLKKNKPDLGRNSEN